MLIKTIVINFESKLKILSLFVQQQQRQNKYIKKISVTNIARNYTLSRLNFSSDLLEIP